MTPTRTPSGLLVLAALALLGCTDGGSDGGDTSSSTGGEPVLEIIGMWFDDVSGEHDIDAKRWVQAFDPDVYTYFINYFDNDTRFVVARSANEMTYSKFEWTYEGEQLLYCASASGQETAAAAEAAAGADASNPTGGGCVGAPWHPLDPQ
jgi:hypothetical protein